MSEPARRIVLAERGPRPDYAVSFEPDAFVIEGVARLGSRRVRTRDVFGIERVGAWLWVGAGIVPVVLGGDDVAPERLARVEAELRSALHALPDGSLRIARLDARRTARLHRPWLTMVLALGGGLALVLGAVPGPALPFATNLLLLAAIGLLAEPWLGGLRALASGGAGWLAVSAATAQPALALAPLAIALGWIGLLAGVRILRERALSVRFRCGLDASALFAVTLAAHALATGAPPLGVASALLAGGLVALLVLRRWPEGSEGSLH